MRQATLAAVIAAAVLMSAGALSGVLANDDEEENAPKPGPLAGDLYPADMGPAEIDVSAYPKEMKQNYKVFVFKCAACHTIARPINSQFIELSADEQKKLTAEHPDALKDSKILQAEDKIWNRYVKRMMAKPGCPVRGDDGKKIWEFLVYDSKIRKTGANVKAWSKQRGKLVHEFGEHHPDGYKKIFGEAPKPEKD